MFQNFYIPATAEIFCRKCSRSFFLKKKFSTLENRRLSVYIFAVHLRDVPEQQRDFL
jgi:hypothetical protein